MTWSIMQKELNSPRPKITHLLSEPPKHQGSACTLVHSSSVHYLMAAPQGHWSCG